MRQFKAVFTQGGSVRVVFMSGRGYADIAGTIARHYPGATIVEIKEV